MNFENNCVLQKKEIKDRVAACVSFASRKMRVQQGKFPEVEDILMKFFAHCRTSSIPVGGPMFMEKAKEIELKLNVSDARFSTRCLHLFKTRHRISSQVISVEIKNVPDTKDNKQLKNLPNIIDGYKQKEILNVDESCLFYHLMHVRTLAFKGDNCNSGKNSKDGLAVLLCTKVAGKD